MRADQPSPAGADHFFDLAVALSHQDCIDDAIRSFDRGLALRPASAQEWYRLGDVLAQRKRGTEARICYEQAEQADPGHVGAINGSALLAFQAGDYETALARFDRSCRIRPDAGARHLKGLCQLRLKRYDKALVEIGAALAAAPDHPEVISNYGVALHKLGRNTEALAQFDRALAIRPDFAACHSHRGAALRELHRFDESLASFHRAVQLDPDYAEAHWNAALLRLLLGDFETGWRGREWGRKCEAVGFVERPFSQPLWHGQVPVDGKSILLHADEGLGDTIQYARYAPRLAARGARVVLEVDPALVRLLSGMDGVACIPRGRHDLPDTDLHCPLSSLPLAFGTTRETIPAARYLPSPPQHLIDAWRARLGPARGSRIGLAWAGNPGHGSDSERSMTFRGLAPLLDCDATFVSLQKEPRPSDLGYMQEHNGLVDLTAQLSDFAETAALICCLDLVITVDTSVAHLAGALFRPTWVMLPFTPDYRWLLDRDDSPWYPTVRLFRQDASRDPAGVIGRVTSALRSFIADFRRGAD